MTEQRITREGTSGTSETAGSRGDIADEAEWTRRAREARHGRVQADRARVTEDGIGLVGLRSRRTWFVGDEGRAGSKDILTRGLEEDHGLFKIGARRKDAGIAMVCHDA